MRTFASRALVQRALIALATSLLVAACGGGDGGGSPTATMAAQSDAGSTADLSRAAHASVPPGGAAYVALGDSFAAGAGSSTAAYDTDLTCGRTQGAYPVLWNSTHNLASFSFSAGGGAKTTDVIASQLSALGPNTQLVTVTAGGNDANGVQTLIACAPILPILLNQGETPLCTNALATFNTYVQTQLPTLLDNMFTSIHNAAPNAKIVAIGYAGTFQAAGSDTACTPLLETLSLIPVQQARIDINASGQLMRSAIITAVQKVGGTFADPMPFFNGHRICTANPPPWINTIVPNGLLAYHPTSDGYANGFLPALNQATAALGF